MKKLHALMLVAALGLMPVGCGESEPPKPGASGAIDKAATDAKATADKAAADTKAAKEKAAADKTATDAKATADKAMTDVKAATDTKAAADSKAEEAKSLLAQLLQYIKDNKLDDADATLGKLDGMKGSLPESMTSQIEDARKALAAKKASSGDIGGALKGLGK